MTDKKIAENHDSNRGAVGESVNYQAWCKTEGKKLEYAVSDRTIAQNTANYHARNTGHTTTVEVA